MKGKMTKDSHLFLHALMRMANRPHVINMIESEIRRRLSNYPFLKDIETRRHECISERGELIGFQFHPPLGLRAIKKLDKWKKHGDSYLYWCWRNATINYCRGVLRKGEEIDSDVNSSLCDPIEQKRIAELTKMRKYLESFLDPEIHSPEKIRCFSDRLDGMTFSSMMKKYEPHKFFDDKKGQKYSRRFSRFISKELNIKEDVMEYFRLVNEVPK